MAAHSKQRGNAETHPLLPPPSLRLTQSRRCPCDRWASQRRKPPQTQSGLARPARPSGQARPAGATCRHHQLRRPAVGRALPCPLRLPRLPRPSPEAPTRGALPRRSQLCPHRPSGLPPEAPAVALDGLCRCRLARQGASQRWQLLWVAAVPRRCRERQRPPRCPETGVGLCLPPGRRAARCCRRWRR